MPKFKLLIVTMQRIYSVLPGEMRPRVWMLFVLMTILGIVELASIMALTLFFATLHSSAMLLSSWPIQKLIAIFPALHVLETDQRMLILWVCVLPIGLIVLKNVFSAVVAWRSAMLGEQVAAYVGNSIMARFLHMPYSWHLSAQSSEALTAMQRRFNLGQLLLQLLTAYSSLITVALLFLGLILYAPGVTLCSLVFMLLVALVTYRVMRRRIDCASRQSAEAQQEENKATLTAIDGVRELIIYQRQPVFLETISKWVKAGMRPRSFLGISSTVPTWTLESGGFLFIWFSVFLLVHIQDADVGVISTTVAMLALTAWRILPSLNRVMGATVTIRGLLSIAMPCLDYLEQLRDVPAAFAEAPDANFHICREIVFDHVSFRYPGAESNALTDICCRIPVGATIGLVGRSGSGKSTFINILSGLLEPTEGRLLVDGQAMNGAQLNAYRQQVGYVPQHPYLLAGTIAQNVAFRDWGQAIDEERVKAACRDAAIDFLGSNFEGIDRNVSPKGHGLSGGQMQRVSIARSLYTDPVLLIFDEATSALDQASEGEVQQALAQSKGQRINIIAAHRLTTLEICDGILWLDHGRLKADGTVEEIIPQYLRETHVEK